MPGIVVIRKVCMVRGGFGLVGLYDGIFIMSLFRSKKANEISSLKRLALSVIKKSPKLDTDPIICETLKQGYRRALETFAKNVPPEAVTTGVVAAAKLVCGKAVKQRFV